MTPILGQDARIVGFNLRAMTRTWHDKLAIACFALIAPAILADRLAEQRAGIIVAVGAAAGAGLMVLMLGRLRYLAEESPLAAEALRPAAARAYLAAWHAPVALAVLLLVAVARPALAAPALAAYVGGALVAALGDRAWRRLRLAVRCPKAGGAMAASWRRSPRAAMLVSAVAAGLILAAPAIGMEGVALLVFAGLVSFFATMFVTPTTQEVVTFQSIAGHGLGATLARNLRFAALVGPVAMLATAPLLLPELGVTVVAIVAGVVLFRIVQVMAFRAFPGRAAEFLLIGLISVTLLIGVTFPPSLPFVLVAAMVWLWRRARPVTWLLE